MALWEAISTAVESLSWDNVQMNELGVERNSRVPETLHNDRVILAPALIGLFAMTPDEFSEKCRQLALARNCRLFRGRDGSIAFRLDTSPENALMSVAPASGGDRPPSAPN
jgi:hypothetical protein